MKSFFNKIILTLVISTMIFIGFDVNLKLYFVVVGTVLLLFIINLKLTKNIEFLKTIIIVSLGSLASYVFIKVYIQKDLFRDIWDIGILFFFIGLILAISVTCFIVNLKNKNIPLKKPKLMLKRERDLEMLLYYIKIFNIVGLNGSWGTGKSFLINELKEKIKDDYEVIEIDILSCNLDELKITLIKELEEIMYKNKILPKYSNRLKNYLGSNSISSKLQGLQTLILAESKSYSEIIEGFKQEINNLDKKIVVIYEDIDRLTNNEVIKEIFSISEKISSSQIKIIYQYDEEKLKELEFSHAYLEKYIPFKMNISAIGFFEILKFLLSQEKDNFKQIKIEDFDFLKNYSQQHRYNVLSDQLGYDQEFTLNITKLVSIRKVENFLLEMAKILEKKKFFDHKEVVISFFFLKHFLTEIYEKLDNEKGILDTLKFKDESIEYTIIDLIRKYKNNEIQKENIEKIFEREDNRLNYCVLKLFNFKDVSSQPIHQLKALNENDKKNRLIWSLLYEGKSQYTDYEYVGNKFINDVLSKPKEERVDAYNELWDSLYNQDVTELDNGTIFMIGESPFEGLFKAFQFINTDEDQQIELVNFYFELSNINHFTNEVFEVLNICELRSRNEYINILRNLNNLEVKGNFNKRASFVAFLYKYIKGLSQLSYIDTSNYYLLNLEIEIDTEEQAICVIRDLEKVISDLTKLKQKIFTSTGITIIEDELNVIINFVQKLIEIIKHTDDYSENQSTINTSWRSQFRNQKEFDRLKEIAEEGGNFKLQLEQSYLENKINVYEIERLIDQLDK